MSNLIVVTILFPLALGLAAGLSDAALGKLPLVKWIIAAVIVAAVYLLLEGLPPFPPVASKQKLGYLLGAIFIVAPLARRLDRKVVAILTAVLLATGLLWMGSNKLLTASAWPGAVWLIPLPIILGIGVGFLDTQRSGPDALFAPRLATLSAAIAGAVVALLDGFVGLGQLQGALAAGIGGGLIIAYLPLLRGKLPTLETNFAVPNWLYGAALSTFVVITACFAPSPDPIALYLVALTLFAPHILPALPKIHAALRPILFGPATAIPAAAAIGIAFWHSLSAVAN